MRNKLIRLFKVTAAMLCTVAVLAAAVPLETGASAVTTATTTDYLNLRQGAGTDTRVILTLIKNATVTVLDNSNSQWTRVRTASGYVGYCYKQYLRFSGDSSSSDSSGSGGTAKTTTGLNMRNGPSLGYGIITVLPTGTSLTVLDNSNSDWVKVQMSNGRQGWCSRQYLIVSGASSSSGSSGSSSSGLTATMTDYLNLRTGAGMGYRIILTMGKGSSAAVLDNSNSGWVQVRTSGGTTGWCSRDYVKISGGSSGQTPTPTPDPTPDPTPTPTPTPALTGATVTDGPLRLRSGAGTSYEVLDSLPIGTYVKSLGAPQNGWMKVQTLGGKTGYVSTDYIKCLYDGDTGSSSSGGSISICTSTAQIPQGKTLWLKPSGSAAWTSSDTSVATVTNGYVYAVAPGTAQITGTSGSNKAVCSVTVTQAEPVRATYASPNIAAPGSSVTFTAVTDTARDGVRFLITMPNGGVTQLDASLAKTETTNGVVTKVWSASQKLDTAGVYSYTAVSSLQGSYSEGGAASDVMVATQGQATVSTNEQRRASDSILNLIANWEGYSAGVYADTLTYSQVPTIGYGYTLGSGAVFYNNISKTEAWAMLVNAVNRSSYTTELNRMVANNNFLINQNQADALISFAYNIGSGYFNCSTESGFRRIMKNAVVPPTVPASGLGASATDDVSLRRDHTVNSDALCGVASGTHLTVTGIWNSDKKDVWYAVRLSDGTTGWINAGYVNFDNSASMTHDLNYTNAVAFGSELILWNQAGGKFLAGLFYRRLNEANVYNAGDYKTDHSYLLSNPYGYTFPRSASVLTG